MKIWITEIGEPLPLEPDVRLHRYGQFSQFLASRGHDVTWWTSSFSHSKKIHVVSQDTEVVHKGVKLCLIHGPGYKKNVSYSRIKHQQDFAEKFFERALKQKPPDLLISPIPTIEVAEKAVRFALQNKTPILTDIRDQWPDELVNLAPKPLRPLARLALAGLYKKMEFVCSRTTGIMAMSAVQLKYGLEFSGRKQGGYDLLFPLGYSQQAPAEEKLVPARNWLRQVGIDRNKFIICFFGTIGRFFSLKTVVEAAGRLEKKHPIQFVLAGEGSNKSKIEKFAASQTKSVLFPGWINAAQIHAIMEVSKAGLAPYGPKGGFSLPNKPFEYMAGGLPIISSIQGELKDLLTQRQCGLTYHHNSVDQLVAAIEHLIENETQRLEMGQNARSLLEEEFATEKVFTKAEKHLNFVIS